MTSEQLQELERDGLTCLRCAVAPEVVGEIRERVWARAESYLGMRRDDPATYQRVPPAIMKKLRETEGLFEPILGPVPKAAVDQVLGEGRWGKPKHAGHLLMTPPDPGEWRLPHQGWHLDIPAPGSKRAPGLQLFLLLDRLETRQGGTLVVGGAHRLIEKLPERQDPSYEGHSAQVRAALHRQVPWLRALTEPGPNDARIARFVEQASDHDGVPLQVVEMTGEPGDVFVMQLWMLHAGSRNTGKRMRMMVTERLFSPPPPWLVQADPGPSAEA